MPPVSPFCICKRLGEGCGHICGVPWVVAGCSWWHLCPQCAAQAPLRDPVCFVAFKESGNWRSFAVGRTAAQRCEISTFTGSRGDGRTSPALQICSCLLSRTPQFLLSESKNRQGLNDIRDISAKSLMSGMGGAHSEKMASHRVQREGEQAHFSPGEILVGELKELE